MHKRSDIVAVYTWYLWKMSILYCTRGSSFYLNCLMTLTCRIHDNALGYTSIGKPNPLVFRNAEMILKQLQLYSGHHEKLIPSNGHGEALSFKTLYMVGDNPAVDIKDARQQALDCIEYKVNDLATSCGSSVLALDTLIIDWFLGILCFLWVERREDDKGEEGKHRG
ncbi:hypothetical protein RJ641_036856 [Dillenia turbinata]|uniref:Uncharacterized protein n=1 Tax=Dillenia turbinata TaxID=194707 RepID=A0AAN8ZDN1_9MAGN